MDSIIAKVGFSKRMVQITQIILISLVLGQNISATETTTTSAAATYAAGITMSETQVAMKTAPTITKATTTEIQYKLLGAVDCNITSSDMNRLENCMVKDTIPVNSTQVFMRLVDDSLTKNDVNTMMRAMKYLEMVLEHTHISESKSLKEGNLTAYIDKADKRSGNLTIYANNITASTDASQVLNNTAHVFLPEKLVGETENATILFIFTTSPKQFQKFSKGQIIGVSISGKNVSDLETPVVISVRVRPAANTEPKCVFYNYTASEFDDRGCTTKWNESWVSCSCDHLTYFGMLLVPSKNALEKQDKKRLSYMSYISQIGSGLSLLSLVVIVVLYFIKWRVVADQSQQVHISLAGALILLNGHFLANYLVANVPIVCVYVAILLHYSVLATFTWTAIEGFHYCLLGVFSTYIRRYLLKLSVVGWGLPAVVVILILIIDKSVYLSVGSSSQNGTHVCYISSEVAIYVTILGFFCVIFTFNLVMLVVVVRTLFFQRPTTGPRQKNKAKDVCTLLGITCLLGISWGLIFFSFGQTSKVGLYLFCICNSLQGFFIFIWLCMSKSARREGQMNQDTETTRN